MEKVNKRKTMNFVDLRTGYYLTGFTDFESAVTASEVLYGNGFKVAYLNEAADMRECDVFTYVRSFESADTRQYQNYHYTRTEHAKIKAVESLKTALELLEEENQQKAKFLMVLAPQKARAPKLEKITL